MKHPTITFSNEVEIPQIGLGTWQAAEGEEVKQAVLKALDTGYRHIDTAKIYGNETSIGEAVRESDVKREDVFVTSKVWNDDQGYDSTLKAYQASLERLGFDYLDLYLVHWPQANTMADTWKAMEKLLDDGDVKAIGVCNFYQQHFNTLFKTANVKPMINQIELHPWLTLEDERKFCKQHDITVEAWAPIARAKRFDDPVIQRISKAQGKTPAQIIIRWEIQHGLVTIPKSVTPSRIEENFDVFDFELSQEEMSEIDSLNDDFHTGPHPDKFF